MAGVGESTWEIVDTTFFVRSFSEQVNQRCRMRGTFKNVLLFVYIGYYQTSCGASSLLSDFMLVDATVRWSTLRYYHNECGNEWDLSQRETKSHVGKVVL